MARQLWSKRELCQEVLSPQRATVLRYARLKDQQRPQREEITPNNIKSFSPVLSGDLQTDVSIMFKWQLLANLVHVCFDHIHTKSLQLHILLSTGSPSLTI